MIYLLKPVLNFIENMRNCPDAEALCGGERLAVHPAALLGGSAGSVGVSLHQEVEQVGDDGLGDGCEGRGGQRPAGQSLDQQPAVLLLGI